MKIRYIGGRPSLATTCSGRDTYYFGPENDFTVEVTDVKHIEQLLSSELHRFTTIPEAQTKKEEVAKEPAKIKETPVKKEVKPKKEPKKKGKKHGK